MTDDRKERLIKLFEAGRGIQYVLDAADEVMGLPFIFIDLKYKLLAHSKSRADNDPLWRELITEGRFSHKTVDFFKTAKFIEAYAASPIALMQCPTLLDRLNGVVYDKNGIQFGSICAVAYNRELNDGDYVLIELVCDRLTLEIEDSPAKNSNLTLLEESALVDLIDGNTEQNPERDKQIESLNSRLKENIYVAVVDTINYEHTITHLVYFTDLFKRLKNEFHYFIYLNNVVVLFSSEHILLNVENEMKELNDFFIKYNIFAGVSSNMKNLYDLQAYFKEALNALNYGMSLNSNRQIFNYDNFRIEILLNSRISEADVDKLYHPQFLEILNYDKRNKTKYLDFFNTYFCCGLNLQTTAKNLKTDKKEISAMLKNAAKLFQIDFTDGNMLFAIFRSIKLYKCFFEMF